jgi:hypothetical protein
MHLRKTLKSDFESGRLREVGESSGFFKNLARVYPSIGSKIAWSEVPGSVERAETDGCTFTAFFDEVRARFGLSGPVIYVGDSATDFALEGAIDVVRGALDTLTEVPQHHYFIGAGYAWCVVLTMESDMAFGHAPPPCKTD